MGKACFSWLYVLAFSSLFSLFVFSEKQHYHEDTEQHICRCRLGGKESRQYTCTCNHDHPWCNWIVEIWMLYTSLLFIHLGLGGSKMSSYFLWRTSARKPYRGRIIWVCRDCVAIAWFVYTSTCKLCIYIHHSQYPPTMLSELQCLQQALQKFLKLFLRVTSRATRSWLENAVKTCQEMF